MLLASFLTDWGLPILSLALLGVAYGFLTARLNRLRLKDQLELEKMEAERLKHLDKVRTDFFSNVTHEFRTPLTLILGHLEQVIAKVDDERTRRELRIVQRNAKQLGKLINQLLDIAKIEADSMDLNLRHGNIVGFLKDIHTSFKSMSEAKKVALVFEAEEEVIDMSFDPDKIELIFYNLLSNAFKFTENGEVSLRISRAERDGRPFVRLAVQDTGIGIVDEQIPRVFDRFYQSESARWLKNKGTGIGLALVKELVELHRGHIDLKSISGVGTEITILLPVVQNILSESAGRPVPSLDVVDPEMELTLPDPENRPTLSDFELDAQNIILVVEDNDDIRRFVSLTLDHDYRIFEANNGTTGWELAKELVPDLIITDIMMPGMDGYQLTKQVKRHEQTSHIPVIMLTARAGEESRIEGLQVGADAYIPKPFSGKELQVQIQNLIAQRQLLKQKYSRNMLMRPNEVTEPSMEEKFLMRVRSSVEKHMADENFTVEELAADVGLSRAQLHRKLIALTGVSASRYVRNFRLEHAMDLLKKNVGTVSEIAYRVGFASPAYFTKCFTEDFGMPPSQIRKEN
ncbi:MAG: response regulator [Flavobacteriales bacterium]|nr:response regulator [Flavobacteriales bacterium]